MGSVFTSSDDRAGGDGVKLSLSVDDPKLPPQLPFDVKLIVSFKLLLLLFRTLLFVLSVLLLFPENFTKNLNLKVILGIEKTHHLGSCDQYL